MGGCIYNKGWQSSGRCATPTKSAMRREEGEQRRKRSIKADPVKRDTSLIPLREILLALLAGGLGEKVRCRTESVLTQGHLRKVYAFNAARLISVFHLIHNRFSFI